MADQMSDRTEAPSSKRLSDARNRGQVVKSQDLSGVVDLLGALVVVVVFGGTIATTCAAILRRFLAPDATGFDLTPHSIVPAMKLAFGQAGLILLPALGVAAVVAFIAQFMQVGWKVTPEPIRPKLDKLDPIKGLARVFGKKGLIKTGMNTLKLTVVLTVAYLMVVSQTDAIAALPAMTALGACYAVLRILLILTLVLLAIMLVIGVVDYAVQRWQHTQDLRMTKQEVKDERRSMEGDPQVKGKRLQMARQIIMQQLGKAVPEADVVITNPTHFSVAIKYDTDSMRAPRVTAKGADEIALRIRQIARKNKVTIVERPPLARALYWGVEVGQEIAPEHYEAVAEVLAYVYRLDPSSAPAAARDRVLRPASQPVPA